MLVGALQTLATVGGARQAGVVAPEAGGALPLGEDPADDALPRRGDHHVRDVQQLGGQHAVIQLELTTKSEVESVREIYARSKFLPWHLKDQHRWSPFKFNSTTAAAEALVKQVLHCGHRHVGVLLHDKLVVVRGLPAGELQEGLHLENLRQERGKKFLRIFLLICQTLHVTEAIEHRP